MAALSQLSYSPFEEQVLRKSNTRALPVARCCEPEVELMLPGGDGNRDQEAPIEVAAVNPEEVSLGTNVCSHEGRTNWADR